MRKDDWNNNTYFHEITKTEPDIILVGLGFPEQEQWIDAHARRIPSVRIAMAIGGAFDFWTKVAVRAPQWMQRAGLEWVWRFMREPRRWKRIWNAIVVFPLTVLLHRR